MKNNTTESSQPRSQKGAMMVACSLVVLTALAACGKKDDSQTVGQQVDTAIAKTEQAAAEAKAKAETSLEKAGDTMKSATQSAEATGQKTADSAVALMDDVSITAAISAELARDADLSALKINVDTKNGNVTLNGPASTAAVKEKATMIAKAVKGVNSVDNKLVIKAS